LKGGGRPTSGCLSPEKAVRAGYHLHPEIGPITLDCDSLTVSDSDFRLVVYTAARGSEAASQLELLAAIGLQQFS